MAYEYITTNNKTKSILNGNVSELSGVYTKELFRNYKTMEVCFLLKTENEKTIMCYGKLPKLTYNTYIKVTGEYRKEKNNQDMFCINDYIIGTPTENESISFILGLKIHGLGEKKAKILTDHFNSSVVSVVKSCNKSDDFAARCPKEIQPFAIEIYRKIKVMNNEIELSKEVLNAGGNFYNIKQLEKLYGKNALDILRKNPYTAGFYSEMSFYNCEQIAMKNNISGFSDKRAEGILLYAIKNSMDQGDTFITIDELRTFCIKFQKKTGFYTPFEAVLAKAVLSDNVIMKDKNIYLKSTYTREENLLQSIKRLTLSSKKIAKLDEQLISDIEKEAGITFSDSQKDAFNCLTTEGIKVITGEPGAGKTTLTNGLIKYIEKKYPKAGIALCAPTGRAAQNMAAKTMHVAETAHKLLGLKPFDKKTFKVTKKMDSYVYIIDESSMVDLEIADILLQSFPSHSIVIFIGDANQLPSVGAGSFFSDLLNSGIEKYVLKGSHRQEKGSTIITNALRVNNGDTSLILSENDFDVIETEDEETAVNFVMMYGNIDAAQILLPMNKGETGSFNISKKIQKTLDFDSSYEKIYGNVTFHIGDKVILTHNNYEDNYYNGDTGIISDILDEYVVITLDDVYDEITGAKKRIEVKNSNLGDIALSYAITIHKSQGGEYNEAVIMLTESSKNMMSRNLLYTAITRAKKKVTIITQTGLLEKAIKNIGHIRNSCLSEKICHILNITK